mgnify:FL=1
MAQSALKYDEFDQMDQVPIPAGGIATFLTAETGSWADDDDVMPKKGIAQVHQIADKLAEYGRNEDEYMVHAAEGETVIPMEVFDKNPTLRNKLFAEMRLMGIEPERYVVGNELNSINPVTGQPEFFLKKLFKGLKKIVKMVLPVIATIALTAVGVPYPIASAIVSGAQTAIAGGDFKDVLKSAAISGISAGIANKVSNTYDWAGTTARRAMIQSGINTALSGGSTGDVLKGAAVAGVVSKGAEFATGAGGKIEEADKVDFLGRNINPEAAIDAAGPVPTLGEVPSLAEIQNPAVTLSQADFDAPILTAEQMGYAPPAQTVSATPTPTDATPAGLDYLQNSDAQVYPGLGTDALPVVSDNTLSGLEQGPQLSGDVSDSGLILNPDGTIKTAFMTSPDQIQTDDVNILGSDVSVTGDVSGAPAEVSTYDPTKYADTIKRITGIETGDQTIGQRFGAAKDLFMPRSSDAVRAQVRANYITETGQVPTTLELDAAVKNAMGPLRTYGPAAAAGLGLMALAPKPDQPELTDISNMPSGQDLIDADFSKYRNYADDYVYQQPNFTVQNVAGQSGGFYGDNPIFQPTALAAKGGIMDVSDFPRRNGGIAGPGTETSDDIPAMLSDGEFVFTAQAVRGAGKGSREDGMKNMYQMMRQFEARA